ncbi:HsmA family protein [Paenibacillus kribbensis]|uniref:TIGR03987 family protein n=1 Tax=Paenibacillus kribbensis TaxID=172713 RepID=A0A222WVG8_9BACL|nr:MULTISPECIES: HsmA family protein [Paenibacillus]ASR49942.1 TIGR03987 family protein [Paenibacillus kribbensis]MEC0236185.1 HsmA family protein [Paenibacillus kribbensis]
MLFFAVLFINLALVAYTIGVWAERISGRLKPKHLVFFLFGLLFDGIGTGFMGQLNPSKEINLHGITGMVALVLMLIHAIWATIVLWRKNKKQIDQFHKLSLAVWGLWLVPYLIGVGLSIFK